MMSIREIENIMPGRKDLSAVLNSSVENFNISNELHQTLGRSNSNSRSQIIQKPEDTMNLYLIGKAKLPQEMESALRTQEGVEKILINREFLDGQRGKKKEEYEKEEVFAQ